MNAYPSIESATEKMKSGATEFKEAVTTQGGEVWNRTCDKTQAMIRNNPYRSVMIAFGIGALAGLGLFFISRK